MRLGVGLYACLLASFVACVDLSGIAGGEIPTPSDAGPDVAPPCAADTTQDPTNCGACGRACAGDEVCAAGACVKGCRDRIVYVSPAGDDASLGCTRDRPKKTITSAVSYVTTARAAQHEVRVCAGSFTEHELTIAWPMVLRGKYDCTTWEVAAGSQTLIVPDTQVTAARATLTVTGTDIGASTVLEGLTVKGGDTRGVALSIIEGASPLVTKCELFGGKGVSTYGVLIAGGPEISECSVHGGEGTTADASPGSAAMGIFGGAAYIHDNTLRGGTGTSTASGPACSGIRLGTTDDARIERNTIHPGSGSGQGGVVATGIDLQTVAASGTVFIADNVIRHEEGAPLPSCTATSGCNSIGIRAYATGSGTANARIHRNRVQPAPVAVPPAAPFGMWAIAATSATVTAEIVNNFLHTGVPPKVAAADAETRGIVVRNGAMVTAAHNTIVMGSGSGAAMVLQGQGSKGTTANNNLVVASSTAPALVRAFAILDDASPFQSFANNAVVGDVGILTCIPPTCGAVPETSVLAAEASLNTLFPGSAANNKRIASACAGLDTPTSCLLVVGCATSAVDCASSVLATFDAGTFGAKDVFAVGGGLKLKSGVPCLIANGGQDDVATLGATDFFQTKRIAPVSVGAHELDVCTP